MMERVAAPVRSSYQRAARFSKNKRFEKMLFENVKMRIFRQSLTQQMA